MKLHFNSIKNEIYPLILALLFIIQLRPSIVWNKIYLVDISFIIFAILLFLFKKHLIKLSEAILSFSLILIQYLFFLSSGDFPFSFLFIILIIISDESIKIKTYKYCQLCLALLFLTSLIVVILVFVVNIAIPYEIIPPPNNIRPYNYLEYPFLTIAFYENTSLLMRFASVFDEPGVVGTLAALFLVFDKFNFKKWYNIIFLLSGILSFSFFFYFTIIFFLIFHLQLRQILFMIVFCIFLFPLISKMGEILNIDFLHMIFSRFEFNDGRFVGDNRSNATFDRIYTDFLNDGSKVLLGNGLGATQKLVNGIQTYKMIVYDFGIIYVFISLISLLIYAYENLKGSKKIFFQYIIILLFFYYNRPSYLYSPSYYFLFIVAPLLLKSQLIYEKHSSVLHTK